MMSETQYAIERIQTKLSDAETLRTTFVQPHHHPQDVSSLNILRNKL